MSSSASFSLFPCLPFELRDMIWKLSLDHIPRSTGELIDPGKVILHPIQRHHWQARAVLEPGHDQEGEEGALTTLRVRYPIRHFQVNREARAAASAYITKQERRGVWLEEHSRCANPRRCALFFDWERKALTAPQALDGLVGDALFLSLAEYQRYCESSPAGGSTSSTSANGAEQEQQQVVRWGTEWRWSPSGGDIWWSQEEQCAKRWPREFDRLRMAMEEPKVALAVPMELLRRDPNALTNILRWQGPDTRSGPQFTDLVLIVNELPDRGDQNMGEGHLCVEVIEDISQDGWREAAGDIGLSWKDLMRISKAEALAWDYGSFCNILAVRVVPLGSSTVR
ncbi:hypothetical protein ASPACDRAFT_46452 [Aspergillus aculeatus ATCC 16872]|uniref:2EXR domain-containing protein n=1 Tax=Aspergillus aculeatus (strain ATCC 16872 / CBS 172.66 / WB 5094) TaxID=690307 RepID=A0A1L9WL96_ASPA1|nr:uncharacterized protein ASPACDRAFT_46452 [Aspergillus aculeatus ATCC 16872]OJJ96927.1 hypothetical protein ASPACDRAFT_46452 [Aspergillus aculeatus ATCC 16872]